MAVAPPRSIAGHIYIVGAPDGSLSQLEQLLVDQGYLVRGAPDVRQLAEPLYPAPDLVLIDARACSRLACEALATLGADHRTADAAVIALLPAAPAADLPGLLSAAAADFVVAPVQNDELLARITIALGRGAARRKAEHERAQLSQERAALGRAFAEQQPLFARLGLVVELLPVGVVLVSAANQIEQVNRAFCRFVDYEAAELIGRQPGFLVLPEDHAATTSQALQLAAGQIKQFVHDRRRYVRKDGSVVLGRLTAHALRDEAGRTRGVLFVVEDIGVRALVEEELARYTAYQQAIANASLKLLAVAPDEATRARALAHALQQLVDGARASRAYLFRTVDAPQLGLAMQLVAEAWSAGRHSLQEADRAGIYPILPYAALPAAHHERLLAPLPAGGLVEELYGENPTLLEAVRAEGVRSTQTVPVFVEGAHWGFLGFDDYTQPRAWDHTDLTMLSSAATMVGQSLHRWQIEDDLRATTHFLALTGRVAQVGGWAIDLETRTPALTDEVADILELEPGTTLDIDTLLSFYAPEARPVLRAAVEAAIRDGGGWELELPAVTAGGRPLWARTQGMAEQRDGRTVRLFGTLQDVTPRKEAELRLERQLHVEAALARCSQELLAPVQSEASFRAVVEAALNHLRVSIGVEQAYLMRYVPDPAEPYFTMAAFASEPLEFDPYAFPLSQRFPLSLLPPRHLAYFEAGQAYVDLPHEDEILTDAQRAWMAVEEARGRLSIPLRNDEQLWGVLGFNSLFPRDWSAEQVAVLVTAAEMLGHVIRRWSIQQKLRQSEAQFRTAVETMLDGFAIFESVRDEGGAIADFRYRYVNDVGCRLNQRSREEQIGHTLLELFPAHQGSELFADYVRLVETGVPVMRESLHYEDQYGSGERLARVFDVRAGSLGDGFAVVWRDVTDRHLAHQSLAQANDDLLRRVGELRTLNQIAQTLAFTQDLAASLESVCRAAALCTGAHAAQIACFPQWADTGALATPVAGTLHLAPEDLGVLADPLLNQGRGLNLVAGADGRPVGEAILAKLGTPGAAQLLLVPLTARAERIGLLVLASDQEGRPFTVDEQRLAETIAGQIATAITNVRLSEQARHAAMLAERNRVARELHDSATQALYSLSLLAGGWALTAEQDCLTDASAKFTQLGGIALQVLKELRLLIYELRHPDLAEAGLVKALEERLAAVEQRANVRTSLELSGDLAGLPKDHEEQIYAILLEVLNNALRHAHARTVVIAVCAEPGQARFSVRDDGVGFDPARPSAGLGLRSMSERAAAIGAGLTLTSRPGEGTLVELIVPRAKTGEEVFYG